jgi:4a-hydroxytetrahydrobiopterin dehydratase
MKREFTELASVAYWRFEFDGWRQTRAFVEQLSQLSERVGFYPNIDFGATYARVGIETPDRAWLAEAQISFVEEMERLAGQV